MAIRHLLQRAIKQLGSEAKLGAATGYTQNAIWQAKKRERVTPEMAVKIERATGGVVLARDLCPSFPWPSPASPTKAEPASCQ